jgi:cobalamin biosynthesis protein CobT
MTIDPRDTERDTPLHHGRQGQETPTMTTQRFVTHKDHIEGSPTNGRWILLDKEGTQKNGPQGYDYYLIDGNRISSPKWDDTYKIKTELNRRNDENRLPDGGLSTIPTEDTKTEDDQTEDTKTEETTEETTPPTEDDTKTEEETKTEETTTPEETKTEETTEETKTEETPKTRRTRQTTH